MSESNNGVEHSALATLLKLVVKILKCISLKNSVPMASCTKNSTAEPDNKKQNRKQFRRSTDSEHPQNRCRQACMQKPRVARLTFCAYLRVHLHLLQNACVILTLTSLNMLHLGLH